MLHEGLSGVLLIVYVPREWPEDQRVRVRRTILDLEKHCRNLPEEQQAEVRGVIERLKSALREDNDVIGKLT
jgi:hypothetical protein